MKEYNPTEVFEKQILFNYLASQIQHRRDFDYFYAKKSIEDTIQYLDEVKEGLESASRNLEIFCWKRTP